MNTRMHHLSRLGALLALALGAAHVHAQTTYTVPLAFNISLEAPTCSLTVNNSVTVNATTSATEFVMNLTPTPRLATASPVDILNGMSSTGALISSTIGLYAAGLPAQRYVSAPLWANVQCNNGTGMTARVRRANDAPTIVLSGTTYMAGSRANGESGTLPIGMLMGLTSFDGLNSAPGIAGTTANSTVPSLSVTANGSNQIIILSPALYAASTAALTSSYAGLWKYTFNLALEF